MTKTAAIHIGHAKTGSTALQNVLFRAADKLRLNGVLYPRTGAEGAGHHELAKVVVRPARPPKQKMADAMRAEVAAAGLDQVLISSESFAVQQVVRSEPQILVEMLPGYEVHIGCVLREHGNYVQSLYAQYLKTGRVTTEPAAFIDEFTAGAAGAFSRWLTVYGDAVDGRLHTIDYHVNRARLLEWIVADIGLDRADLAPVLAAAEQPSNERLGAQATAILRQIAITDEIRLVGAMYFNLRGFLSSALPDDESANFFTSAQIARVREVYADEGDLIRERWCSDFGSAVPDAAGHEPSSLELRPDLIQQAIDALRPRMASIPDELATPTDGSAPALVHRFHQMWKHHWETR